MQPNRITLVSLGAAALAGAAGLSVASGFARRAPAPVTATRATAVSAQPGDPVAAAQEQVRTQPESLSGYHKLASALMQRQRETGDPELYGEAEQALRAAEKLDQEDYQTRKLLAWVLAGQHRFDEALVEARACVRRNPADYWNYGIISDSLNETGDYDGALAATQKMVDLRPCAASYGRAGHQRRLHGDPEGALQLFRLALEATGDGERESRAWLQTQMADVCFETGQLSHCSSHVDQALLLTPEYHLALATRARLLAAKGDLPAAAIAYERALRQVERPDWRAALGDVRLAQGQQEAAEREYAAAEKYLQERMDSPVADARHALATILADRARKPKLALELAEAECADATDIKALDTLAQALHVNQRPAAAWSAAQRSLRLGTRDPRLLFHAGRIALTLPEHRDQGRRLIRNALALNPAWDVLEAKEAKKLLGSELTSLP